MVAKLVTFVMCPYSFVAAEVQVQDISLSKFPCADCFQAYIMKLLWPQLTFVEKEKRNLDIFNHADSI